MTQSGVVWGGHFCPPRLRRADTPVRPLELSPSTSTPKEVSLCPSVPSVVSFLAPKNKARIAPRLKAPTCNEETPFYCTVNVTPCECAIPPSVAVTVTLNLPSAVGVRMVT